MKDAQQKKLGLKILTLIADAHPAEKLNILSSCMYYIIKEESFGGTLAAEEFLSYQLKINDLLGGTPHDPHD